MRKTRDSGFNHPWGGQKKSWGAIPRALPEGWPRRIFFGTRRAIEDRIPSLTPDNDILHQFKASSAAGRMIISIIIPRELIMIITPLGMKLWILSSLPATGCPKVRWKSNHPLNFGIGWPILKCFRMANNKSLRFCLVYHTWSLQYKLPWKLVGKCEIKFRFLLLSSGEKVLFSSNL